MPDFASLPPEITSARMYSGPGSGPLLAAAAAWDALAGQLDSFATGYSSVISELQEHDWSGSASTAMAGAAAPYVAWATATAARAARTAGQARTAAAAYEAAFTATVPPAVIAANRTQLAILVATNFFGQNALLIAATEAAYAEMWAQDAAMMFGYAASSAAAVDMTPFDEPPQTTSSAGSPVQAAAVAHAVGGSTAVHAQATLSQLLSIVPQHLHALSTVGSSGSSAPGSSSVLTAFSDLNTLSSLANFVSYSARTAAMMGDFVLEANLYGLQAANVAAASSGPVATTGAGTAEPGHRAVLAGVSRADSVGRLSVPQAWAAKTAVAGPVAEPRQPARRAFRALPPWAGEAAPSISDRAPGAGLGPLTNVAAHPGRNTPRRIRVRRFQMPRPAVGG